MAHDGITREEARIQVELLKLNLDRTRRELKAIIDQFCSRQDHDWGRVWRRLKENPRLFRVDHHVCYLPKFTPQVHIFD